VNIVGKYLNLTIFEKTFLFYFEVYIVLLCQLETIFWAITQCKVRSDVSEKRPAFLQVDNMVQIYEVTGT
jgi:hypothetical protein